jgi:hypothetical protein
LFLLNRLLLQEGVKNLSVSPKKKTSQEDDENEEEDDDENEEGEDIEIPIHVQRRVDALRKLHAVVESIDEEYKIERIQLEAKYRDKKSIVYEDRKKVITGVTPIETTETDGIYIVFLHIKYVFKYFLQFPLSRSRLTWASLISGYKH